MAEHLSALSPASGRKETLCCCTLYLHLLPVIHIIKKALWSKNQDKKWGLEYIITGKIELLGKWVYKTEETELGEMSDWSYVIPGLYLCSMDSQTSLHSLFRLHYLQTPQYCNNFLKKFSCKNSICFIPPLEYSYRKLLDIQKSYLIRKVFHENPRLWQKKILFWALKYTVLCFYSSKDDLLLRWWLIYTPITQLCKNPSIVFTLSLHIYTYIMN